MDSSLFFGLASLAYILAMICYIAYLAFRSSGVGLVATSLTVFGFVSHTVAFFLRWNEFAAIGGMGLLRSIPLTNLYESLIFFVWCIVLGYLVIEWKYKSRSFGAFITPIAGMVMAFIDISGISKDIHPLIPALQSNWLLAHVTMSFLAYAAFAISFATAIMYLAVSTEGRERTSPVYIFWTVAFALFCAVIIAMAVDFFSFKIVGRGPEAFIKNYLFKASFRSSSGGIAVLSYAALAAFTFLVWRSGNLLQRAIGAFSISADQLDDLTYKCIAIGFPVFTLGGLIFGAIWADQAWGKYWSWDPKETWSLITWFVYAFYLHARHIRGWRGDRSAIVAVVGFVSTIFTYLGVNLLLSGLHSYGGM
ncbi:MAG TPA: c-type cytochrome biogenesis protein CcsB [Dissulfurispiraceae bacterium]|nr:c-type cytochrome biogenesis protein CcsB [Dissulfurispiraceae bacterium]